MERIVGSTFTEPVQTKKIKEEPLIIHARATPGGSHLAVFVHGLGGSRYGKGATWGDFPRLIFEDFPELDIGMYAYRTLLGRIRFKKSISIPEEAKVLSDVLLSLNDYEHFLLFGHSLGGLMCKSTVACLFAAEKRDVLDKISSMFLMATPQLGSTRVPGFLSGLTSDFRALKAHGKYVEELAQFFQDHIHTDQSYPLDGKVHIPCWALIASEDSWVDSLSAGISLPTAQKRVIRGSHTSIVKPEDRNADSYNRISYCVKKSLSYTKSRQRPKFTPASEDDLPVIHELAISLFGNDVSDLNLMRQWWTQNSDVFFVLRRITRAPGTQIEQIVAYFCLLPISSQTAANLRAGTLKVSALPAAAVLPAASPIEALYIGAIAGIDPRSQTDIMLALTTHLYNLGTAKKKTPVLTRPVTADGLRVVKDYEMVPVDPSRPGIGSLYEFTLS